jgi:hypothetical protein
MFYCIFYCVGFVEGQLDDYLHKNGIQCPTCKSRFHLARGGCMHIKCVNQNCRVEYCSGCGELILIGDECPRSDIMMSAHFTGYTYLFVESV